MAPLPTVYVWVRYEVGAGAFTGRMEDGPVADLLKPPQPVLPGTPVPTAGVGGGREGRIQRGAWGRGRHQM